MRAKFVSALLVCSVVFGGVVAGASIVEQDSQPTGLDVNGTDADAMIVSQNIDVPHGGTATIPIQFDGTDTATVKVGSETVNYVVLVTVTDGDGDGATKLRFDTDAVAEPNETLVTNAAEADNATVKPVAEEHLNGDSPHPPLDPANYPLAAFVGDATEENQTDTATMQILEPTTETTTTERETETKTPESTEKSIQSTTETETVTDGTDSGSDVPGFGVGTAIAALTAATLLVTRR